MIWSKIFITSVLFLLTTNGFLTNKISKNRLHSINLDHDKIKLSWLVDWTNREVLFHIANAFEDDFRWFSFGFSKRGEFERSDLCIFQWQDDFFRTAIDAYSSDDGETVYFDEKQDCKLLRMDDNSIAFKKKFDTCDPRDLIMHEGTMYLLWARGQYDLDLSGSYIPTPNATHENQGMQMVQVLRADAISIPEKKIKNIEIILNKVEVPAQETTYWCKVQKIDDQFQTKHHIVQFEPIIDSENLVHHMEVFHCDTDPNVEIPLYDGDCNSLPEKAKVCAKVMALWAMGASTFTYPPEAGLPIGGKNFNPYIRLEVHFNNPDILKGVIDSSGIRIKAVEKLRKYDAAIMELGLEYTDKMAIPPGQLAFPLSGYCIAECTEVALPDEGIIVFGSQLHTHLRGVRVMTRHFRGNKELRELNRDDYYSHHYQEIRQLRLKPRVMPGDALVTTCFYDTRGYTNTTLGGFSISDEMCVNYIHYYPATKLEVCKSSVSEKTLHDYFTYMKNVEHQKMIQIDGARSDNYRSIQWTQPRIDELYLMYVQEPLSMQCNRSDGFRFEGFDWEGAPITPVKIQMPVSRSSKCFKPKKWIQPLQKGLCDMFDECIY